MKICGIDPGKTGALCFLGGRGADAINIISMPLVASEADPQVLKSLLSIEQPDIVFLEKAQALPSRNSVGETISQGSKSMFTYGVSYGIIRGVIATLGIKLELVPPAIWTKEIHRGCDGKTAKEKSLQAANRLFPHVNLIPSRCRTPNSGWVDALLIAEYGRRRFSVSVL